MRYEQAKKYWEQQSELMKKIRAGGMAEYVKTIPNLAQGFTLADRWLRCIDEGTAGGVHMAGSGILLGVEAAAGAARAAGATTITSHEECGAAKLYAKEKGLDEEKSDTYGQEFARDLAKKLGVNYCHLPLSEMARPAGLHVARVAYYDGTGKFDPARVPELPAGFVISRRYLKPDYARRECEIAISIALGHHGFGELFTEDTPFILVVVGDPKEKMFSLGSLRTEVEEIARAHGGRVAVDAFVSPVQK
ncbi:MAG: hypothetical protein EPN14_01355 [Gallionella sp.]|nr:MAG: hypothetical protein EPN14_01355 [Gallionella sp.]